MALGPWSRRHCKQQKPICKSGKSVTVTLDAKAINMQWSVTLSRTADMLFPLNYCAQDILYVPNPNSTNYHLQARAKKHDDAQEVAVTATKAVLWELRVARVGWKRSPMKCDSPKTVKRWKKHS